MRRVLAGLLGLGLAAGIPLALQTPQHGHHGLPPALLVRQPTPAVEDDQEPSTPAPVAPAPAALPYWDVASRCGVERWPVKVGTDPEAASIRPDATPATLAALAQIAAPKVSGTLVRQPVERQVFQVSATLVQAKREDDGDYHLILTDGGHSLVAEIPHPDCAKGSVLASRITAARAAFDTRFPQIQGRRSWLHVHAPVTVTGVGFFDFAHGQTGEAPNVLELHPLLSLT